MAEQQIRQFSSVKADLEARSLLLMPVMEGHTLETDDISSFLDGRLCIAGDDSAEEDDQPLS